MIKQFIAGAAIGAFVLFTGGVAKADQPFPAGWNKAIATNCVFIPGNPGKPAATPPVPPVPDEVLIFVSLVVAVPPPPAPPPPIVAEGDFTTTDPVAITLIAPYCKDGTPFYFFWDVKSQEALYFSIYPNLM